MTWSVNQIGKLDKVQENVEADGNLPQPIKDYIVSALAPLREKYDGDVKVSVNGSGHLFNGELGNYEVSTIGSMTITPMETSG